MEKILLLHGALASERQMLELGQLLSNELEVHSFSFTGHGGLPLTDEGFYMEHFAQDIYRYLDKNGIEQISLFGYSMGGYAALLASLLEPWRFHRIITLGVKLDWTPENAALEMRMLDTEKMEEKIPGFVAHLKNVHTPNDWKKVVDATKNMMHHLGENPDLTEGICFHDVNTLMLYGSEDTTAGNKESIAIARQHPNAEIFPIPKTPHAFEKVNLDFLGALIKGYVQKK